MRESIVRFTRRYLRWLLTDAAIVAAGFVIAWLVRFATPDRMNAPADEVVLFGLMAAAVFCGVNYAYGIYQRLWRYAAAGEVAVILSASAVSTALLLLIDLLWPGGRVVPASVVLMTGFFAVVSFVGVRYRRRLWTGFHWRWRALQGQFPLPRTRTLIVGAGETGQLLAWRILNQRRGQDYQLLGFVDDDPTKLGMRVHGLRVLGGREAIPSLVTSRQVELIVIAVKRISGDSFRSILDLCESTPAAIKVLPDVFDIMQGANDGVTVRNVTAEDLLGREPVEIHREACRAMLAGRTVLITGAAGSIGSELCRQVIAFGPDRLLALDNNESGLHDLVTGLRASRAEARKLTAGGPRGGNGRHPKPEGTPLEETIVPIVADVTHGVKMERLFDLHRPQIVFHAAAYKHVPLMEIHPDEAVRVNVLGTRMLAQLAEHYGAERFVLVSSDKAINPTSVMGATKRLGEMLIVDERRKEGDGGRLNGHGGNGEERGNGEKPGPKDAIGSGTVFTAVRFGNVLGSRGSVVPTFERQIEQGGPVTVTHPEMTRYFMTIPEAASLILQAASFTGGDDIFMLDMGERISIDSLARRMIRLKGLRPNVDIPVVYTGIRPGEKMHEELLGPSEERTPTSHPFVSRIRTAPGPLRPVLQRQVDELIDLAEAQRNDELVVRLLNIVMRAGAEGATPAKGSTRKPLGPPASSLGGKRG